MTGRTRNRCGAFAAAVGLGLAAGSWGGDAPGGTGTTNAPVHMVIVFPGGPSAEEEGRKMIDQFLAVIAGQAGLPPAALSGSYHTDEEAAAAWIREHRDSFVMGSLAFFLAHRAALALVPLAKVVSPEDDVERFRLMVRKGAFADPAAMKGKAIAGNALYGGSRFLSRIVFGGRFDAAAHFDLRPAPRPLSALRDVAKGKTDGVLLNQAQYRALARLPLAAELQVIHESAALPPLGVMMADTPATRAVRDRIVAAMAKLPDTEAGKQACADFAIKAFVPVSAGELDGVIKAYDAE